MNRKRTFIIALLIIFVLAVAFPLAVKAGSNDDAITAKTFHGKWWSIRWVPEGYGIYQTLKIRCNQSGEHCNLTQITYESRSCTALFREPTNMLLEGKGPAEIIDNTFFFTVSYSCITHPPQPPGGTINIFYNYNAADDTLTDNLGAVWYRE